MKKILTLGSNHDSLCVDFFSGSATTAEAVMRLNTELMSTGKRQYIAVQLPEDFDSMIKRASASEKPKIQRVIGFLDTVNRPHTLDQIGIERIIRSAKKIKEENPEAKTDFGFKHFSLAESPEETLDKLEKFDPSNNTLFTDSTLLDSFGKPTVLATWIVRDGYGLTVDAEEVHFAEYTGYYLDKHLYLVDPDLSDKAIEEIVVKYETDGDFNPENVVLFGYSFTWTELEALQTNLKRLIDTEKNLRINFDIRY